MPLSGWLHYRPHTLTGGVSNLIDYQHRVITVKDTPMLWQASTYMGAGDLIIPTVDNGRVYECTTAGLTGGSEPGAWSITDGGTIADNTVVWTCRGRIIILGGKANTSYSDIRFTDDSDIELPFFGLPAGFGGDFIGPDVESTRGLNRKIQASVVAPNGTLYAAIADSATQASIYRSTDGGVTWSAALLTLICKQVRLLFVHSSGRVFTSPYGWTADSADTGVWISDANGENFVKQNSGSLAAGSGTEIQAKSCVWNMAEDDDGNVYLGRYGPETDCRVHRGTYSAGTFTWASIFYLAAGMHVHDVAVNGYVTPNVIYITVGDGLLDGERHWKAAVNATFGAGTTGWTSVLATQGQKTVVLVTPTYIHYFPDGGGAYRTDHSDAGGIVPTLDGTTFPTYDFWAVYDPSTGFIYVGTMGSTARLARSTDNGYSFHTIRSYSISADAYAGSSFASNIVGGKFYFHQGTANGDVPLTENTWGVQVDLSGIKHWDVKLAATASAEKTIRAWYGNAGASDGSNGASVYLVYDDFAGVDFDATKWALVDPDIDPDISYTVSNSKLKFSIGAYAGGLGYVRSKHLKSLATYDNGLEVYAKITDWSAVGAATASPQPFVGAGDNPSIHGYSQDQITLQAIRTGGNNNRSRSVTVKSGTQTAVASGNVLTYCLSPCIERTRLWANSGVWTGSWYSYSRRSSATNHTTNVPDSTRLTAFPFHAVVGVQKGADACTSAFIEIDWVIMKPYWTVNTTGGGYGSEGSVSVGLGFLGLGMALGV